MLYRQNELGALLGDAMVERNDELAVSTLREFLHRFAANRRDAFRLYADVRSAVRAQVSRGRCERLELLADRLARASFGLDHAEDRFADQLPKELLVWLAEAHERAGRSEEAILCYRRAALAYFEATERLLRTHR
jgi:hypothetical protein